MEIIKRIDSEILIIKELKTLLGKKVKINIEIIEDNKTDPLKIESLGTYNLGKELDNINIRNFVNEEK
jgi:hypothetical protein